MSERWRMILLVFAVILGALLAWWLWPRPPEPVTGIDEIREQVEQLAEAVRETRAEAERKVVVIRETVQAEVGALPPDGVADGLADELSRFRERGLRPERVGDP
jgi:hypothetical protein